MAELPDDGLVRYGGFTFPANTETTGITVIPQYDQAGRTVVYNRIKINLRCVLAGTAIDVAVRNVVRILSKPAFPFFYAGRGYGLGVNVGGVRDVVWGPKPSEATVKPLGGGNAVELTWSVEVAIPDCADARYQFGALEYNFSLNYDIDASGYTTRTYSGHLRVPMTRRAPNDRRLPDSVDSYREDVYPPLILGFRRIPGSWAINAAKDTINFSCQDVQMPPTAPWPGIVECSADHTLSCPPRQFYIWNGTISGTYEVARNGTATIADARNAFFQLVKDRINYTRRTLAGGGSELRTSGASKSSATVMPVSFSMTEPNIYGRTVAKFSLSYAVNNAKLQDMLVASGMWRGAPGGRDFKGWADSLKGTVMSARGHAGLTFSVNDDRIVDLCQPGPVTLDLGGRTPGRDFGSGPIPPDVFPEPDPDSSWVVYTNSIYLETDNGTVEVRTLPTEAREAGGDLYGGATPAATNAGLGAFEGIYTAGQQTSPFFFPPPRKPDEQKKGGLDKKQPPQRRARQSGALYMIGRAVRIRYAIPSPTATRWGTATLTPANRADRGEGFWTGVIGNAVWPVSAARWRLRYLIDLPPSGTPPVLPSPTFGGGGAAGAAIGAAVGDVLAGLG
jgi:hypothetical protein